MSIEVVTGCRKGGDFKGNGSEFGLMIGFSEIGDMIEVGRCFFSRSLLWAFESCFWKRNLREDGIIVRYFLIIPTRVSLCPNRITDNC